MHMGIQFLLTKTKPLAALFFALLVIDASIVAGAANDSEFQQGIVVRGTVTSADDNSPMPGVNIVIKGTATGTTTDSDGDYSISVPDSQATLIFTFIGYERYEITVGTREVI